MILYSCVCYKKNIIVEHFCVTNQNLADICRNINSYIDFDSLGQLKTQNVGNYVLHCVIGSTKESSTIYVCITDGKTDALAISSFLGRLQRKFELKYPSVNQISNSVNKEFSDILRALANKFNNDCDVIEAQEDGANSDEEQGRIELLKNEIDNVKDLMVTNIDAILERGENLNTLITKTDTLQGDSTTFRTRSTHMVRRFWWQNMKWKIILAVILICVVYLITSASCGGLAWPKCVK